jgi:predicted nucleotidyltransferase component of viral defense system
MTSSYPDSFASLASWSRSNGLTPEEARIRLAQFAILCCTASFDDLKQSVVFKGGNALDFVWQPNRSTRDLDFSINWRTTNLAGDSDRLQLALEAALERPLHEHQIKLKLQSWHQNPPRPDASFATFRAKIGYAFVDEARLLLYLNEGRPSTRTILMDISTNEEICAYEQVRIAPHHELLVSTREDIVAEKLRSLLQQQLRNRSRGQDLLDIAVIMEGVTTINLKLVGAFLLRKAAARGIYTSKRAFTDPELIRRASIDYNALRDTTRVSFVEFDVAILALQRLVAQLDIPD